MTDPAVEAAARVWDGEPEQMAHDLVAAAREAFKPLRAKHAEWVAALNESPEVVAAVALAVLDDLAPLIYPEDEL